MFNVRCWTIATILLAWTFTVSAEITQFSPEDNAVDVCPVPVFGWQDSGNAVAFSVYLSEDQKEISELALPAEDLNNDGKVDYADFLIFSQKTHMPAEQPILKQWVKMANAKNIMNMIILAEPKKRIMRSKDISVARRKCSILGKNIIGGLIRYVLILLSKAR